MERLLHQLSAFFFYVLGLTFFLASFLLYNRIGGIWPAYWLQVADLPLALSAILYAGISLYRSVRLPERHSWALLAVIFLPLVAFFLFLAALNFWPQN